MGRPHLNLPVQPRHRAAYVALPSWTTPVVAWQPLSERRLVESTTYSRRSLVVARHATRRTAYGVRMLTDSGPEEPTTEPTQPQGRSTIGYGGPSTAGSGEEIEIETAVREMSVEELKSELLTMVNGSNRGIDATKAVREGAIDLIKQLDSKGLDFDLCRNPELLHGQWRLVFTNALDILSLALLPFVRIGPIYQNVEAGEGTDADMSLKVTNIVDLTPGFSPVTEAFDTFFGGPTVTRVLVTAKGTPTIGEARRLDIVFVRSAIKNVSLFGLDLTALPKLETRIANSAVGFIETIYIDGEMRIARAPPSPNAPRSSNYFVLLREDESRG